MTEGSGINKTQIWVTVITVIGGLLTAIIVNGDKWFFRDTKPVVVAQPAVEPVKPTSGTPIDISGEWHDDEGSHFGFEQSGATYQYTHTAMNGTLQSSGKGTISDHELSHTFETLSGETGTCNAHVNAALNKITGNCVTKDGGWTFVIER